MYLIKLKYSTTQLLDSCLIFDLYPVHDTYASLAVETKKHFESIDVLDKNAVKGDDSNGKVIWSICSIFAAIFLAGLYTSSQIILYFTGGSLSFIEDDLQLSHGSAWLPTANILAISAACPYTGYLQGLFGKRYIALFGSLCICLGCTLLGTAYNFAQAPAGMALSGVGAAYRGYSLALLTAFVFPSPPYLPYVELWSHGNNGGWRWGPWTSLIYNGIIGFGLLFTYFPQYNHTRAEGFSRMAVLKKIDYVGGVLSITGLTLFAYVLCTLLNGLLLIIGWVIREWEFAAHPMVPSTLFKGQRIVGLASVYDPVPLQIGVRELGPALATAVGIVVFNAALSMFPGHTREILLVAVLFMTAFAGSLAVCNPENEGLTIALGLLASFGVGGVLVPAATIAMIVCPDSLLTTVAALSLSIAPSALSSNLPKYTAEYAVRAGLPVSSVERFVGTFLTTPEIAGDISGVTPAVVTGATRYVWFTSIAFGSMAVVCTILLPSTEKYQMNRVAVRM
ncbi:hypothetical protein DM02DRAFT_715915 [Periconia macrospinosa]|uniref:MFS general substrate transporter n=1 Tax=Periconia macrospinosa TaxID=97972 RepID=A0A2V1E616_9PLEO|nr:hypothetical protein DM02DRAFT_715915 [Periconia macrospinosa]